MSARTVEEIRNAPLPGEPVYRVAEMLPQQGQWTESTFLRYCLGDSRVEFVDGNLEFLAVPTRTHQRILFLVAELLRGLVDKAAKGETFVAGYRVRMAGGNYREPDVVVVLNEHLAETREDFTPHADLVVEVVSTNDPERDWVAKKAEYAASGIAEYWIIDPRVETLTIFRLDRQTMDYDLACTCGRNEQVISPLLGDAGISVDEILGPVG
ncbi:Uma2 family endonuclease [Stratiformator vulcanicus]|uniref:Putative restriction endonuclease domain-containing protein n=1 Tax=Stratiformator vulcanicus TaxID=2527980 RepID=A0A517QWQ0_9PLAN|nr:Uma2 family endonuclease [Stratiformator vulcanicus]QDT36095.1 hypothetical protein Pan189_04500 [Stratiformator vulcanicus]